MAATKKTETISIKPIQLAETTVRVVGLTELCMHKWSEKAKREMLEAMQKNKMAELGIVKTKQREDKKPFSEFLDSMYWISGKPTLEEKEQLEKAYELFKETTGESEYIPLEKICEMAGLEHIAKNARFGFPSVAFKSAAISGAYRKKWVPDKVGLRGAFWIEGDQRDLVEIKGAMPIMREDSVKIQGSGTDLRYRGAFENWYADLKIKYDLNGNYSISDILNYLSAGGYVCGIGEWRTEKGGQMGMYEVTGSTD